MPHVIDAQRLLVLADRQNSVLNRKVLPDQNQIHSWMRERSRGIDFPDACVGVW
jgi:hypothetical protein